MANTYLYGGYYVLSSFDDGTGAYTIDDGTGYITDGFYIGDENDGDLSDGTTGDGLVADEANFFLAPQVLPTSIFSDPYKGWTVGDGVIFTDFGTPYLFVNNSGLSGSGFATSTPSLDINALCFLPDTRIETPRGPQAIETLQIGDLVTTASGAQKPVKWIGRMQLPLNRFTRATATPVCIRAGALGENLPQRDLYVSADHAIAIDGILVNASVLVNGETIVRCVDLPGESVDYFQIELEDHDLILAEGTAAETFFEDGDNRAKFDNADEFHALYPQHERIPPMPLGRVISARQLPAALRRRLAGKQAA